VVEFPIWLATEEAVGRFFILMGFMIKSVSICGRQIDLLAIRVDPMTGEEQSYIIEITTEKVGVEKGSRDSQKLLLAQKRASKCAPDDR
jgi:hypothetical protein